MSLIKLSDACWVEADDISEVKVNEGAGTVTVRMRGGIGHHVTNDYGKGAYATLDRLVAAINAAKSATPPAGA